MLHTKSMFNCWEQHLHGRYQSLVIINKIQKIQRTKMNTIYLRTKTELSKRRNVMTKNNRNLKKQVDYITFCLSEMNTKFNSSGLPISSTNVCKNHTQESLFSCSTTPNATGNILSFPSLAVADNICLPNLPFKWQPSNPTNGLHPPPPRIQISMHYISHISS